MRNVVLNNINIHLNAKGFEKGWFVLSTGGQGLLLERRRPGAPLAIVEQIASKAGCRGEFSAPHHIGESCPRIHPRRLQILGGIRFQFDRYCGHGTHVPDFQAIIKPRFRSGAIELKKRPPTAAWPKSPRRRSRPRPRGEVAPDLERRTCRAEVKRRLSLVSKLCFSSIVQWRRRKQQKRKGRRHCANS